MNRIESIHVAPTTEKKTEQGRFGAALKAAATGLARGVAATVELAAPYVPGGTVLSAAVRGASGTAAPALRALDGGAPGAGGGSSAGTSETDAIAATRTLQQEARTFNLQYLQLQEQMQRESREFTSLSNVMKVKHDSAKAAIANIT